MFKVSHSLKRPVVYASPIFAVVVAGCKIKTTHDVRSRMKVSCMTRKFDY